MHTIKISDLKKEYKKLKIPIDKEINSVIKSCNFILGPKVIELENKLKKFINCKYAIGVSSGTDALLISLLSCNVKVNDEIIIPSLTWVSTAEVISLIGAKPVFVDVNLRNGLIDINKIKNKITKKTKAIIAVGLYGFIPNLDELKKLSKQENLYLIDDAAQSFGSKFNKKYSTNYCDMVCTSFFPGKILGCYGDGGAIFTNNKKLYQNAIRIRNHGQIQKSNAEIQGINGRLDSIQAAILIPKLKILKKEINLRKRIYNRYQKKLTKKITILQPDNKCDHNYSSIPMLTNNRENLKNFLEKKGIQTQIIYNKSVPEQKFFRKLKINKKDYINSNIISKQIISIPCHGYLKKKDVDYIINSVNIFYDKK